MSDQVPTGHCSLTANEEERMDSPARCSQESEKEKKT